MFTFLYLQRRRLGFGALFFFLAGLLQFSMNTGFAFPGFAIGMALLFTAICTALAAIGIYFFPAYPQVWEIVATTFFAMRAIEAFDPPFLQYTYILDGAWGVIIVCFGYTLLHHAIYGQWWARTPIRLSWTGRSRFQTAVPPEEAWQHFVPQENAPERYYSGTLHEFRPADETGASHIMRTRMGGAQFLDQLVTVVENDGTERFAYTFGAEGSEENADYNAGRWQVTIRPAPMATTDVEVIEEIKATTPGNALLFWFDDLGGQVAQSMKRVAEQRNDPTLLGWLRRRVLAAS